DREEESIEKEPLEEPKKVGWLEESKEKVDSDLLSDARSRPGPAESVTLAKAKSNPSATQHKFISSFTLTRCYR
ncbi:hypothetical protein Tco_1537300, partial [Tanacetum coccineum]